MKPETRAAYKETPPDHEPFEFGLLPGDRNEYVITSGAFKGQGATLPATRPARWWEPTSRPLVRAGPEQCTVTRNRALWIQSSWVTPSAARPVSVSLRVAGSPTR